MSRVRHDSPSTTPRLTPQQLRQVMRLQRELHQAGEPAAARECLLKGICEVVKADRAVGRVSRIDSRTGRRVVVATWHVGPSNQEKAGLRTSRQRGGPATLPAYSDNDPADSAGPRGQDLLDAGGFVRCMDSFVWLSGPRMVGWIAVGRPQGARKFTPRQRALLDLIHEESAWLYREFLPQPSTEDATGLPSRPPTLRLYLPLRPVKPAADVRRRPLPAPHSA